MLDADEADSSDDVLETKLLLVMENENTDLVRPSPPPPSPELLLFLGGEEAAPVIGEHDVVASKYSS